MRIVSGKYKGRKFTAPKNLPTRPTTDFAKEALFNILNHRFFLNEITVLDLFAGIGSISLEFVSRGATKVTAVEQFGPCVSFIQEVTEKLEIKNLTLYKQDVFKFLGREMPQQYDIIFADPPFDMSQDDYHQILNLIFDRELLNNYGLFILEHGQNHDFSTYPKFLEHKKYGNVHFSFFENNLQDDEE